LAFSSSRPSIVFGKERREELREGSPHKRRHTKEVPEWSPVEDEVKEWLKEMV
jgi:hypothetical protein